MPSLPENASVATESTVNGALNLNRINLIGVFGTTSDRSALVRMPGGKVVRVQVGDTLDGGRIAAIGEDNLYYVKNGQNVQLRMPNG
jgi:type IV pilus biogenesis protein PilP